MGMELLILAVAMLVIAIVIDYMKKVTVNKSEIWGIVIVFAVVTALVEQIGIMWIGLDVKAIAADWVYGIWILNVSLESLMFYFILPYAALVVYFGLFSDEEDKKA